MRLSHRSRTGGRDSLRTIGDLKGHDAIGLLILKIVISAGPRAKRHAPQQALQMIAPVLTAQLFGVQPLFLLLLLLGEKSLGFLHSPGQPLRDVAFQHKICYRIFDSGFGVGKIRIRVRKITWTGIWFCDT